MARPRTYKTEGIVLKQMPLGEADRILTLYTTDLGKLRAVARGVRRPKSRLAGHLEPLTRATVSVSEGRSLDHIAEAETLQSYRRLREDLELVSKAMYLADLVDSFTVDRSPSLALFNLLAGSLARLESARSSDTVLRYFEVQLLHTSGFGPELRQCVECRGELEPATHHFCPASGGILCACVRAVRERRARAALSQRHQGAALLPARAARRGRRLGGAAPRPVGDGKGAPKLYHLRPGEGPQERPLHEPGRIGSAPPRANRYLRVAKLSSDR